MTRIEKDWDHEWERHSPITDDSGNVCLYKEEKVNKFRQERQMSTGNAEVETHSKGLRSGRPLKVPGHPLLHRYWGAI